MTAHTWPLTQKKRWVWSLLGASFLGLGILFQNILPPFILGLCVAYLLNFPVSALQNKGVPRFLGTFCFILIFFLTLGGAFFIAIPFLKEELLSFSQLIPKYGERIFQTLWPSLKLLSAYVEPKEFSTIHATASQYLAEMLTWFLHLLARLLTNTLAIANLLSLLVLTPVISFYFLRDWPKMLQTIDHLLPHQYAPTIRQQAALIHQSLGGYLRGQVLVCLVLMIFYILGLSFVGLNFSLTIGLITGLFAFIPYLGFMIGLIAGLGVALAQFQDWGNIGWVASVYAIGQTLESYLLTPKLVGDRIGLHPVWIIFSLLASGGLLGFMGILIALPVATTLSVVIRFGVQKYKESPYYLHTEIKRLPLPSVSPQKDPLPND